jgi:hypothetical protein
MTADRFIQTPKANDSGSWNKYSYTRGDPVTRTDRHGTCDEQEQYRSKTLFRADDDCDPCEEYGDCDPGGGDPAPTPTPQPTPTPTCDIQFGYTNVAGLGKHTFLEITQTTAGATSTQFLEGVSTDPNSPYAPPGLNLKWTYLNAWQTPSGAYDDGTQGKITWDAAKQTPTTDLCNEVGQIEQRFGTYQNWQLRYLVFKGPNSNSFMHWLISGISGLSGISPPSGAVGWKKNGLIPY